MAENIIKALQKHLDRLTWKCGECEASESSVSSNFESRYCQTIIEAAIREELTFQKPFPIDPDMPN